MSRAQETMGELTQSLNDHLFQYAGSLIAHTTRFKVPALPLQGGDLNTVRTYTEDVIAAEDKSGVDISVGWDVDTALPGVAKPVPGPYPFVAFHTPDLILHYSVQPNLEGGLWVRKDMGPRHCLTADEPDSWETLVYNSKEMNEYLKVVAGSNLRTAEHAEIAALEAGFSLLI